ncbi:hypothetical protein HJFPF1_02120 [Paramyrothecium foliicola]|nr:hypothetical protein HJFPF1_02120 [Paramyrothecium foliicola]
MAVSIRKAETLLNRVTSRYQGPRFKGVYISMGGGMDSFHMARDQHSTSYQSLRAAGIASLLLLTTTRAGPARYIASSANTHTHTSPWGIMHMQRALHHTARAGTTADPEAVIAGRVEAIGRALSWAKFEPFHYSVGAAAERLAACAGCRGGKDDSDGDSSPCARSDVT